MQSAPHHRSARRPLQFLGAVVALLVTLVPASPAAAQTFVDVSGPHQGAIEAILGEGITEGCAPNRYCPEDPVTRAQMASFLSRALGLPAGPTASFSDVVGNRHEQAIGALAERGITEGCAPNRYCPNEPVSRQQMASFLGRAFDVPATDTTYFYDIVGTHEPRAQALGAAGISDGCDSLGLTFCPTDSVRRDQMASFLARTLELVPRTSIPLLLDDDDSGPDVRALQARLAVHGYWVGPIDGVYGTLTQQAVMAFQKVNGLGRDGVYGPNTRAAFAFPADPNPRSSSGYVVEFDENRQVVMLVRDGRAETIFHASGGDESYYTHQGTTYWAETPNGTWDIYREIDGWRTSHLGELWRPKYFHTDGIAFHGYTNVPATAASHGCVRLSMEAMDWVWANDAMPIGTRVMVYGTPG